MSEKKRKSLYWAFRIASILISCAFPIWGICEKFPVWTENHGAARTVGVGFILICFVLLIVFRKTVFSFVRDKLKIRHAPPLAVWIVFLIISYILVYIGVVMRDMTTVFWLGLIGCCIGTFLTFIAEQLVKKEVTSNE